MIEFMHPLINSVLNINLDFVNNIVIENPNFLVSIVEDIQKFLNKVETEARFLENNELCKKIDKIFMITDLFAIDFNNKSLQNTLIKRLVSLLNGTEYQINEIYQKSYEVLHRCLCDLNISVDVVSAFDKSAFVKMFAPTIQCDYQNLLDKIVSYVNILVELIDLKCLIVLNLYEFLSKEECEQFFYHCKCRDVAVLVLSSRKKYAFNDEQFLLIDEDLCEIVAKLHNI